MGYLPVPLKQLIEHFSALPGIGRKTAQRLAFYMLDMPEEQVKEWLAESYEDSIDK